MFKSFPSTTNSRLVVDEDDNVELDRDRDVALVLLDLSAAFKTINTRGVIDTLYQQIGVTGVPRRDLKGTCQREVSK